MRTLEEEMRLKKQQAKAGVSQKENPSVESSMRRSFFDGGFFGIMSGFSEPFIIPFALLFNAPNILVSILSTAPLLLGSTFQLFAPRILAKLNSRRRYLTTIFLIQGAAWLLLPWVSLIQDKGLALLCCVILAAGSVSLSHTISSAWLSYMGDLIPQRARSGFFSKRNAVIAGLTFVATLGAGLLLRSFSNVYFGFGVLFTVAALARWGSAAMMMGSREIPTKMPKREHFSLTTFFRRAPRSDFGRFVTFTSLVWFAAYIAAPFFVVYQLKVLKLDYLHFTILQCASVVGSVFALQLWGKVLDWQGTRRVLMSSAVMIGFVPLLYLTTSVSTPFALLLAFEVFSGAAWSGFKLAANNYALEATDPEARPYVFTYSSLLNNGSIFLAGLVGGLLLTLLTGGDGISAAPFLTLFAISGALRLLVAFGGSLRLREIRFVNVRLGGVFSYVSILPQQGMTLISSEPEPTQIRDNVEREIDVRRNVEEQLREAGAGRDVVERMDPEEREVYTKKFLERIKK